MSESIFAAPPSLHVVKFIIIITITTKSTTATMSSFSVTSMQSLGFETEPIKRPWILQLKLPLQKNRQTWWKLNCLIWGVEARYLLIPTKLPIPSCQLPVANYQLTPLFLVTYQCSSVKGFLTQEGELPGEASKEEALLPLLLPAASSTSSVREFCARVSEAQNDAGKNWPWNCVAFHLVSNRGSKWPWMCGKFSLAVARFLPNPLIKKIWKYAILQKSRNVTVAMWGRLNPSNFNFCAITSFYSLTPLLPLIWTPPWFLNWTKPYDQNYERRLLS